MISVQVAGLARCDGAWIGGDEIQADLWTTARELFVPATQCDEPKPSCCPRLAIENHLAAEAGRGQ